MSDYDVVRVSVSGDLSLQVSFADGVCGVVRFLPTHLYGVFEPLKDPKVFSQVRCSDGFVSWPGEIDLAPDAMHEVIKQKGEWVLA